MLDGKTAVITGASNGIGREIAITFAEQGADVVVADVVRENREGNAPTNDVVDGLTSGEFVETDVSDPADVTTLFDGIEETFGGLDVLVNNAAVFRDDRVTDLDLDLWQGMLDVSLTGTFLCCKHGLPLLLDDDGNIINISSIAGLQATSGRAAYCATKAAITNLTRQIALDYGPAGVRANSIHPGLVNASSTKPLQGTDKWQQMREEIPLRRFAETEDIANVATFLASDMAAYVNGHQLVADGGLSAFYH